MKHVLSVKHAKLLMILSGIVGCYQKSDNVFNFIIDKILKGFICKKKKILYVKVESMSLTY